MRDRETERGGRTRRINSWAALVAVVAEHVPVYVRWSRSPALDRRRGYSLNHASKTRERGLSVQTIDPWVVEPTRCDRDSRVAALLLDYQFCGPVCSLWTGEVVGRGGDDEDVIEPRECLGIVGPRALAEAAQYL